MTRSTREDRWKTARWYALWALMLSTLGAMTGAAAANNDESRGKGPADVPGASWPLGGQNIHNTRNNADLNIQPGQAARMQEAWNFDLVGDAWCQPTVAFDKVFMCDNAGWVYAFNPVTGAVLWQRELVTLWDDPAGVAFQASSGSTRPKFAASRTAPAAAWSKRHGAVIYIGDQAGNPTLADTPFDGANIYAIDADDGKLIAITKIKQEPAVSPDFSILTGAMAVHDGVLVTGVSGLAEANPQCFPGAPSADCTFRGRVMAFDADTLAKIWEVYTVPPNPYAGASVWQSTPTIDPSRNRVYVGTGDNYKIPEPIEACIDAVKGSGAVGDTLDTAIKTCIRDHDDGNWKDNHFDSILAIRLKKDKQGPAGQIVWSKSTLLYDAWTLGCLGPTWAQNCGPDMDFSQHPMLCRMRNRGTGRHQEVLVVGQKTGDMFGLNPDTGAELWKTSGNRAGDDFEQGLVGGFQWGSACTRDTVVGLFANSYGEEHQLPGGAVTRGGTIVGFDSTTGAIGFETPQTEDKVLTGALLDTAVGLLFGRSLDPQDPASNFGAPSCAGRTCFWGSSGVTGFLFATDTKTGKIVFKRPANGSVIWGGAIVRLPGKGTFWYVGSGYGSFTTGQSAGAGPNFWAFRIPDEGQHH